MGRKFRFALLILIRRFYTLTRNLIISPLLRMMQVPPPNFVIGHYEDFTARDK